MNIIDSLRMELLEEAKATRQMLERAPQDKFGWKPHEKSMTLGRLASHVAEIPGWTSEVLTKDEMVFDPATYKPVQCASTKELLALFDDKMAQAEKDMAGVSDARMMQSWRLKTGDKVVFEAPRVVVIRSMMLNHAVHHRGQLSVYLRLLEVPLPPVYGPTADDRMGN